MPLRAELRRVEVLGEIRGTLMVRGDLTVGDQIAVDGAFKLSDGSLARLATQVSGA